MNKVKLGINDFSPLDIDRNCLWNYLRHRIRTLTWATIVLEEKSKFKSLYNVKDVFNSIYFCNFDYSTPPEMTISTIQLQIKTQTDEKF